MGKKKSPGKHCCDGNLKCETLTLSENEHITKVLVRAGDWIDAVWFITDKGQKLQAGGNGGNAWLGSVPQGHHWIATSGGFGKTMHNLTFYFDEIF